MIGILILLVLAGLYLGGATLIRRKLQRDQMKEWLPPSRRRWRPEDDFWQGEE